MTKSKAVLSLIVDSHNNVDVKYEGAKFLRLSMLGALDFGKDWLLKQIPQSTSAPNPQQEFAKKNQSAYPQNEETVNKSSALSHYIEMRDKIEARLQIIAKSSPQAKFKINEYFKEIL